MNVKEPRTMPLCWPNFLAPPASSPTPSPRRLAALFFDLFLSRPVDNHLP